MLWNVAASIVSQHVSCTGKNAFRCWFNWFLRYRNVEVLPARIDWFAFWHLPSGWMCLECKNTRWRSYFFKNLFISCMLLFCFHYRNHQCGLHPAVWRDTHRSIPAPLRPRHLSPSVSSLLPLIGPITRHNAHQRVPHPHAHECGGVPHRPALHDPGEAKSISAYNCCVTSHEIEWLFSQHFTNKQRELVCW